MATKAYPIQDFLKNLGLENISKIHLNLGLDIVIPWIFKNILNIILKLYIIFILYIIL